MKGFHILSWSKNVVSKVNIVGEKSSDEKGAKRILNDAFHETLLSLDDDAKLFSYSIDDGSAAVPKDNVKGYIGDISVLSVSADSTSFVMWWSYWKSTKEDGIADFCNRLYHTSPQDLKGHFA